MSNINFKGIDTFEKSKSYAEVNKERREFVKTHMEGIESVLLDKEGKIPYRSPYDNYKETSIKIDELFTPYEGKLPRLYHGTDESSKASILKNGFDEDREPIHGLTDGIGGIYFMFEDLNYYGNAFVEAEFKGKVAQADSEIINEIKEYYNSYKNVSDYALKNGIEAPGQSLIQEYLRQKAQNMGYDGIITTNESFNAGNIKYFSALNQDKLEIIK